MSARVLLWVPSRLLRDILARLVACEPGFEVAAPSTTARLLSRVIQDVRPQVIITDAQGRTSERVCDEFLQAQPGRAVLSARDDSRWLYLSRSPGRHTAVGELSPELLVAAVRAVTD